MKEEEDERYKTRVDGVGRRDKEMGGRVRERTKIAM